MNRWIRPDEVPDGERNDQAGRSPVVEFGPGFVAMRLSSCRSWANITALAVLATLAVASPGQAQTVRSYESLDRSAGEDGYATAVFLFDGAIGNAEYLDTDFSGALGYRGESHWLRVYPAYRVKRSNGNRVIDTRSVHLRHSLFLTDRSQTFAFVQLQSEKAIDLDRRFLLGGGIRYQLFSLGTGGVDLGVGVMLDEERRTGQDTRSDLRGANFVSVYGDAGAVRLSGTTYFQPVMTDWGDHRVLVTISAIVPLVSHLSVDVAGSWRREVPSPGGIETNDAALRVGFRLDLN